MADDAKISQLGTVAGTALNSEGLFTFVSTSSNFAITGTELAKAVQALPRPEVSDPAAPPADTMIVYVKDDGGGRPTLYERTPNRINAVVTDRMFGGTFWNAATAQFCLLGDGSDDDVSFEFLTGGSAGNYFAAFSVNSDPTNIDAYAEIRAGEVAGVDFGQVRVEMGTTQEGTTLPAIRVRQTNDSANLLIVFYTVAKQGLDLRLADLGGTFQSDIWAYNDEAGVLLQGSGTQIYLSNVANGPFLEMTECAADVAAPATDHGRLYVKDAGDGTSQPFFRNTSNAYQIYTTQTGTELVQDVVAGFLQSSSTIVFVPDDAGNKETAALGISPYDLPQNTKTITQTGYTLVSGDNGYWIEFTGSNGVTVTIPPNSSASIRSIAWSQSNIGQLTFAGAGTAKVYNPTGLKSRTTSAVGGMFQAATDRWLLWGDVSA